MQRFLIVLVLLFGALGPLAPRDAEALSIEIVELSQTGCTIDPIYSHCFGSTLTIGLRVENSSNTPILGMGLSAFGYDNSLVGFDSSSSGVVDQVLAQICVPGTGCFGGLTNQIGTGHALAERAFGPGVKVQFFAGVGLSPIAADGTLDPGLDGVIGARGAQFELSFTVLGPGITIITFGSDVRYGDSINLGDGHQIDLDQFNRQILVSSEERAYVIPEPSSAILSGLGLLMLSALRERRHAGHWPRGRADVPHQ